MAKNPISGGLAESPDTCARFGFRLTRRGGSGRWSGARQQRPVARHIDADALAKIKEEWHGYFTITDGEEEEIAYG